MPPTVPTPTACAAWQTTIVPRLPADLELQARLLGALQRHRGLPDATTLLRGVLQYALNATTFTQLGIWGVLSGVADLAPSSWFARLRAATPWLRWLCGRLIAAPVQPRWLTQRVRGRVLLVDATTLGLAHGPADAWRLHLAYDLLAGRLAHLHLTDRHGAESLQQLPLAAGDLVVADAGYGHVADLCTATRQGADVTLRVHLPSFPLQQADGRPLDLVRRLARLGSAQATLSLEAYVLHAGQRQRVRVIAARLPRAQQGAAARRFRTRARRKGRTPTATGLELSRWLVIVTTLDADAWPAARVVALYRVRWQVETRIKRLKQLVTGQRLPSRTAASGEAVLWAQLVGWALHEPVAQELRAPLAQTAAAQAAAAAAAQVANPARARPAAIEWSGWQISALVLTTVRQAICGQWDLARVTACLPRLQRYLGQRQRHHRVQQEQAAVAWLRGLTPAPDGAGTASGFD